MSPRLPLSPSPALPANEDNASSGSYDYYNSDCRQPYHSLLAGNGLFRRGCDLSGSPDCARTVPAANQVRKGQDASVRVRHRPGGALRAARGQAVLPARQGRNPRAADQDRVECRGLQRRHPQSPVHLRRRYAISHLLGVRGAAALEPPRGDGRVRMRRTGRAVRSPGGSPT